MDDPKTPPNTPPRATKKAKYAQKYAKHWESLPAFKGWLQPSKKRETRAYCKACDCELNAKKSELERHAQGQKHINSVRSESTPPPLTSLSSERDDENPKTEQKRYKFEWESDPNLKEWVLPDPVNDRKVFCKYCHCSVRANKTYLYKHRGARKHSRNACNFSDEEKKFTTISKSSLKPQVITEKLKGPGESVVLVKCQQPPFNQDERENSHFIIDYGDNDHVETTIESESPENEADQKIREIATRIGGFLRDDLEALLKSQESIIRICKSAGDDPYSDGNLRKIAKICVAHLSQKYLVETVLESKSTTHFVTTEEQKKLSIKFKDIEKKLERTVAEMKSLMYSLDGGSETQNFSTIDFADLLVTASNQNE